MRASIAARPFKSAALKWAIKAALGHPPSAENELQGRPFVQHVTRAAPTGIVQAVAPSTWDAQRRPPGSKPIQRHCAPNPSEGSGPWP